MKKMIAIFPIILLLSLNINTANSLAVLNTETIPGSFSEGLYNLTDLNLLPNIKYNVRNISSKNAFLLVFDDDQKIQQAIRLGPNMQLPLAKPLQYSYKIVIIGDVQLVFIV